MTDFSTNSIRDGLRSAIKNHAEALAHLDNNTLIQVDLDAQMRAVRLMADIILNLNTLNPGLMSPPPFPVQSMINLVANTDDVMTFAFAVREFVKWTTEMLDRDKAEDDMPF
jgi:hypothetical protein